MLAMIFESIFMKQIAFNPECPGNDFISEFIYA